jgi:hypothetical protein
MLELLLWLARLLPSALPNAFGVDPHDGGRAARSMPRQRK